MGCTQIEEDPLILRVGAEPSAKMRNDEGIKHFKAGRNYDALLQFNQANLADPTSGEIHFNLGRRLGVQGTPSIITEEGKMIPGYLPPRELLNLLETNS